MPYAEYAHTFESMKASVKLAPAMMDSADCPQHAQQRHLSGVAASAGTWHSSSWHQRSKSRRLNSHGPPALPSRLSTLAATCSLPRKQIMRCCTLTGILGCKAPAQSKATQLKILDGCCTPGRDFSTQAYRDVADDRVSDLLSRGLTSDGMSGRVTPAQKAHWSRYQANALKEVLLCWVLKRECTANFCCLAREGLHVQQAHAPEMN